MSRRQRIDAVNIARIPSEHFERVLEENNRPTVTYLADYSRRIRKASSDHCEIKPLSVEEIALRNAPQAICEALRTIAAQSAKCDMQIFVDAVISADDLALGEYDLAVSFIADLALAIDENRSSQ